jgi:hypothetical protein
VGHAHERFDAEGRLRDENLQQQLRDAVDTLSAELPGRVPVAA